MMWWNAGYVNLQEPISRTVTSVKTTPRGSVNTVHVVSVGESMTQINRFCVTNVTRPTTSSVWIHPWRNYLRTMNGEELNDSSRLNIESHKYLPKNVVLIHYESLRSDFQNYTWKCCLLLPNFLYGGERGFLYMYQWFLLIIFYFMLIFHRKFMKNSFL